MAFVKSIFQNCRLVFPKFIYEFRGLMAQKEGLGVVGCGNTMIDFFGFEFFSNVCKKSISFREVDILKVIRNGEQLFDIGLGGDADLEVFESVD